MNRAVVLLLATALPALASTHDDGSHAHEHVINQASELLPWCKAEAEARYIARNITPYQWTASHHERGNVLHVDGRLRVNGSDVSVRCRIARGAREQYATIEIDEPKR